MLIWIELEEGKIQISIKELLQCQLRYTSGHDGIFEKWWHSESSLEAETPGFVAGLVVEWKKKRRQG